MIASLIELILKNLKLTIFVVVVIGAIVILNIWGRNRQAEGERIGSERTAAVYADSLRDLRHALTRTDSLLSIKRDPLPRIVYRFRDRAVADSATLARLDSAVRSGQSWQQLAERMSPMAVKDIDTTQYTDDSLAVPMTGQMIFDPLSRDWFAWFQPAPLITRTWLVRTGYILPPEVIRYDWSAELMLGSPVRSPALRLSPSVWHDRYGIGADFERGHVPVLKLGYRMQW